jgi:hypothetical protein
MTPDQPTTIDGTNAEVLPPLPAKETAYLEALRPSSLAALSQCPRYMGDPTGSVYTERGQRMDAAFRLLLGIGFDKVAALEMPAKASADLLARNPKHAEDTALALSCSNVERANVEWAVQVTRIMAGGTRIFSADADCKVKVPGLPRGGTCDAVLPDKHAHHDLKSGEVRDYTEQMAAYAYGHMETHFCSEWTARLLFCDARQVVTYRFSYEQAKGIVEGILEDYRDPDAKPTPCDYCGWCALRDECTARRALATQSQAALTLTEDGFAAILADPDKLARFITGCAALDDYKEKARHHARDLLKAGKAVPGYKLQVQSGKKHVMPGELVRAIPNLTGQQVADAYGNMSAGKFETLWAEHMGAADIPAEVFTDGPQISFVKQAKEKKEKEKKPKKQKTEDQ